ncbi:MAG: DUF2865 domain-containing protein [Pseudomonadota bacterium]
MRCVGRVASICFVVSAAAAGAPAEASAQSFFEGLFGIFSSKKPSPPPPAAMPAVTRILPPPGGYSRGGYFSYEDGEDYDAWERRGAYRAVCVRLCDGYYWPISNSVPGGSLHRAARQCASSCDGEARLFYQSSASSDPETLVDLAGRRYRDLPNALLYRKRLIDGCTCKPMPWTAAEAARHRGYAADQAEALMLAGNGQKPDAGRAAEVIAGGDKEIDPKAEARDETSTEANDAAPESEGEAHAEHLPAATVTVPPTPVEAVKPARAGSAAAGGTTRPERATRTRMRPAAPGYSRVQAAPAAARYTWPGDGPGRY